MAVSRITRFNQNQDECPKRENISAKVIEFIFKITYLTPRGIQRWKRYTVYARPQRGEGLDTALRFAESNIKSPYRILYREKESEKVIDTPSV